MAEMATNFSYGSVEFSSRASARGQNRTILGSDFEFRNAEFTSQAIGNRQKRHQRITPIMKWEFQKDTMKLMTKIRTIKPVVDSGPPKFRNVVQTRRYREEHEQIRLDVIEKENQEMLDRLWKIHTRPRSSFCHSKRRGDYLVKGDACRLPPPSAKGNYLVEMYKKLKFSNPLSARKSIRVQQEMLASALDIVQKSNKSKPSEEMIEIEVQSTLSKEDEILPESKPEPDLISPVAVVQLATPNIDPQVLDDMVMALSPIQQPKPSLGNEELVDANKTSPSESFGDIPQSVIVSKTLGKTTQSMVTTGETPGGAT